MATLARANRQASKANAWVMKAGGGGSTGTSTTQTSRSIGDWLRRAGRAVIDEFLGGQGPMPPGPGGPAPLVGPQPRTNGSSPCAPGRIRLGNTCVDPGAAMPGGVPLTTPASGVVVAEGGQAVVGAFGQPGRVPEVVVREHRRCPRGMVLGADDICYPKSVLRRNSRFRKWRPGTKPLLTGGERRTLRRAETLRDEVRDLAKGAGFKVTRK